MHPACPSVTLEAELICDGVVFVNGLEIYVGVSLDWTRHASVIFAR